MEPDTRDELGLLARALAGLATGVCRRPWLVLFAVFVSCAVCGVYTWNNLAYLTHRNDLISSNKDYLKRWRQYVEEFGDDDDMVVVVRGDDRAQMQRVLDDVAHEIEQRPEVFERLFYKVDLRALHSRALLYLPTERIRQIQHHLQGMSLLLEPPVLGTFDPWFGWRSLSVQQLLRESERRLAVWKHEQPNPEAEAFFKQLDAVCVAASATIESPSQYRNPWHSVMPTASGPSQEEQLAKVQYFFSSDAKLASLLVSPKKSADSESFTYSQDSIRELRAIIAKVKERHRGIGIGLTGLPVLENDEMVASQNDSNTASWLALLGVSVLYFAIYRGFRYPLMTVAPLIVGTVWALGWLTLTVGHLNILSSAFAVMLIGIGDYGVLWVTRFGQERQAGCDLHEAMRNTAIHVGPSICTAAVTTAFSFFAAMLADLQAVSELGWIAGSGVILCALSCFVVTPALLAILDFRVHPAKANDEMILSMAEHREANREWLPWLMRKPRWVLGVCAFVTLVLAGFASSIEYDHNLLNLQAQSMDSVKWEKTLIENMSDASWYAVSWTTTPEEALALKAKYEELPMVSNVHTMASLIPLDQERKMESLRDIQYRLRKLPPRGEILDRKGAAPNVNDVKESGERVLDRLAMIQSKQSNEALAQLQTGIKTLLAQIAASDASTANDQLANFDQWMTRDLAEDLHRLHDVSSPTPIRLGDLPGNLRERFIGKNGKWLVRVFSKECLWDFGPLESFINQVRTVDADSTGKPFTTLEGLKAMRNGFLSAGLYALIAMVIVLLIDFGRVKHTLVAFLPLAMGMIATLGIMALLGCSLNPANMIAFPLILGVGADNGVHVLHDFRSRDRKVRYRLSHATGRGIMVAALTTILGFGTLMIAQHQGMASLGLILTVGVTCCMGTALVFLPALLYVMGKREKPVADVATLPLLGREAA